MTDPRAVLARLSEQRAEVARRARAVESPTGLSEWLAAASTAVPALVAALTAVLDLCDTHGDPESLLIDGSSVVTVNEVRASITEALADHDSATGGPADASAD